MVLNVILGNDIGTLKWINNLKEKGEKYIIVLDYGKKDADYNKNNVIYTSPNEIKKHLYGCDKLVFYKSMYGFPGMGGQMSKLINNHE